MATQLEDLNRDHHRRMADAAASLTNRDEVTNLDNNSRASIISQMYQAQPVHGTRTLILEVGAGGSGDSYALEEAFDGMYLGIEVVPEVAERAWRQRKFVLPMALHEAPWSWNGLFDVVYARHVMEHMLDPELAARDVYRLLKPGGVLGAVTPHYFPDPEPAHVTQYHIQEWADEYTEAGFTVVYQSLKHYACEEAHIVCVK